jgi:hypothetical protein
MRAYLTITSAYAFSVSITIPATLVLALGISNAQVSRNAVSKLAEAQPRFGVTWY